MPNEKAKGDHPKQRFSQEKQLNFQEGDLNSRQRDATSGQGWLFLRWRSVHGYQVSGRQLISPEEAKQQK
jgi:hypothetical protein